jgi:hypothetical protein
LISEDEFHLVVMVPFLLLSGLLVAMVVLATLLALGGLLRGFVPALAKIELKIVLILVLFLPPLISFSAWLTSWCEFRAGLRPILRLAEATSPPISVVKFILGHSNGLGLCLHRGRIGQEQHQGLRCRWCWAPGASTTPGRSSWMRHVYDRPYARCPHMRRQVGVSRLLC